MISEILITPMCSLESSVVHRWTRIVAIATTSKSVKFNLSMAKSRALWCRWRVLIRVSRRVVGHNDDFEGISFLFSLITLLLKGHSDNVSSQHLEDAADILRDSGVCFESVRASKRKRHPNHATNHNGVAYNHHLNFLRNSA